MDGPFVQLNTVLIDLMRTRNAMINSNAYYCLAFTKSGNKDTMMDEDVTIQYIV